MEKTDSQKAITTQPWVVNMWAEKLKAEKTYLKELQEIEIRYGKQKNLRPEELLFALYDGNIVGLSYKLHRKNILVLDSDLNERAEGRV